MKYFYNYKLTQETSVGKHVFWTEIHKAMGHLKCVHGSPY